MGNTGNSTGLHLHFEIRDSLNIYDKTIDPSEYMGITNKTGFYNSKDYEISEVPKFVQGDIVKIPIKFTGAEEGQSSLIEIADGQQLWVYNSILNKEKTEAKAVICFVDQYKIMVEIDSITQEAKQFWVGVKDVHF